MRLIKYYNVKLVIDYREMELLANHVSKIVLIVRHQINVQIAKQDISLILNNVNHAHLKVIQIVRFVLVLGVKNV